MSFVKKGAFATLILFWALLMANCGLSVFDDDDRFTYNRVRVRNESGREIHVAVQSNGQLLDTTGGNLTIDRYNLDTVYQLDDFHEGPLYDLELPNADRSLLRVGDLLDNIDQLHIFVIEGNDTIYAQPVLERSANWESYTDELFYTFHIIHHHTFLVKAEYFD